MQPSLAVGILVLQAEGLVSSSGYVDFALQFPPIVIIAEPNQFAVLIGHLPRDTDLVAVEVVGLLAGFLSLLIWFRQAKPRTCVPLRP